MKMKRKLWFPALFLACCLLPSLGMLFFGPSPANQNELQAPAPKLRLSDGGLNDAFFSDAAAYVSDRFFLRRALTRLHSNVNVTLFGVSPQEGVLAGRDGWLFYADTLADHTGTDPLTDEELRAIANTLSAMRDACAAEGRSFLFVLAPDKNAIYPEKMRDYGVQAATRDGERLLGLLTEAEVPCVDLYPILREAARTEQVYFAHDSHWNSRGAALAADAILAALGRSGGYYDAGFQGEASHEGDLYAMLYPGANDPETDPVSLAPRRFTYAPGGKSPDSITINTRCAAGSGRLLAFRDSFGALLYPYLADAFAEARFSRAVPYALTQAEETQADCVLVELVERNLRTLIPKD